MSSIPTEKTVADRYDLMNQVGGFIVSPSDGDNEMDYIVLREVDQVRESTVYWTLITADGEEVYTRTVPDDSRWTAQAWHDMEEEVRERHPDAEIYAHQE